MNSKILFFLFAISFAAAAAEGEDEERGFIKKIVNTIPTRELNYISYYGIYGMGYGWDIEILFLTF